MRLALLMMTVLVITFGVYIYGYSSRRGFERQQTQFTEDIRIAECVKSYTGEDASQWAWSAYGNVSTKEISQMTGVRETIINDCEGRKQEVNE